jgi:hypothetical protein
MKRLIVVSLLTAVVLMRSGFPGTVRAQTPSNDLKPTFISPTPGLYVNGWPAFTVSYPKEWVEIPLTGPLCVHMLAEVRPDLPPSTVVPIFLFPSPLPLEDWAKFFMRHWENYFTDIKVLADKPSQLKDGTPAREVEMEFVPKFDLSGGSDKNAPKCSGLLLATKKDLIWVAIWPNGEGKLREDWKRIAYSLTFQPEKEKPVIVPPDVKSFLDMYYADTASGDLKAIMAHFSDRFRHFGASKPFIEQIFRNDPAFPIQRGLTSCEATVTVFEPRGEKAFVDGFVLSNARGDATALKAPMTFQQIINEHGEWKWFGNQK